MEDKLSAHRSYKYLLDKCKTVDELKQLTKVLSNKLPNEEDKLFVEEKDGYIALINLHLGLTTSGSLFKDNNGKLELLYSSGDKFSTVPIAIDELIKEYEAQNKPSKKEPEQVLEKDGIKYKLLYKREGDPHSIYSNDTIKIKVVDNTPESRVKEVFDQPLADFFNLGDDIYEITYYRD